MAIELIDALPQTRFGRLLSLKQGALPRICFAGDSIASIFGNLSLNSPFFWAQVRKPRLYESWVNIGQGNAWSGAVTGHAAQDNFDLNTPGKIAAAQAANPDILVIECGTNDASSAGTETFANIKAFIEAVDPLHCIVFTIMPRLNRGLSHGHANQLLRRWAMIDPRIRVIDVDAYALDAATASGPLGGSGGDVGDLTYDALHPGPVLALRLEPRLNQVLDAIGVPRADFLTTSQSGNYDGTNQPYGNLLDTRGAMGGSGGTNNSGGTGTPPTGWNLHDWGDANSAVNASASTITVDGAVFPATKLDFVAGATLPAPGWLVFEGSGGGVATPAITDHLATSLLVQIENLADCYSLSLQTVGAGGTLAYAHQIMGGNAFDNAAGTIPSGMDEVLRFVPPTMSRFAGGAGAANMALTAQFRTGAAAGAKGSIRVAQAVLARVPASV